MKKPVLSILLLISAIIGSAQSKDTPVLTGPYLGQKPPGMTAEIFAPAFVSTREYGELNAVFTKNGNEFYFSRRGVPGKFSTIMVTRQVNGRWINPEPVNFSGKNDDIDLFITSDGKSMIFSSYEEKPGNVSPYPDHDFRISNRVGDKWSSPVPFAVEAVSGSEDYFPVVTGNGNLYFNSQRGGRGTNDIYISKYLDGKYTKAQKLPSPINTTFREYDAFISSDESFMIFSSEKPGGYGSSDLYISLKKSDGSWSEPHNLGKSVNSEFSEYGTAITPDGRYLFFTSNRNGSEDIFWISTENIEGLKPGKNQKGLTKSAIELDQGCKLVFDHTVDPSSVAATEIVNQIRNTLSVIQKVIPADSIEITIAAGSNVIPELGVNGRAESINSLSIVYDPGNIFFKPQNIPPVLAHEIHHLSRHRMAGWKLSLPETMILEGLADHFSIDVTNCKYQNGVRRLKMTKSSNIYKSLSRC